MPDGLKEALASGMARAALVVLAAAPLLGRPQSSAREVPAARTAAEPLGKTGTALAERLKPFVTDAAERAAINAAQRTQSARAARARQAGRLVRHVPVLAPVRGPMSSPFGWREHPIRGGRRLHRGIDLAVPTGTPVVAPADGEVAFVGHDGGYGLSVRVWHPLAGLLTLYGHLDRAHPAARPGVRVRAGAVLGYVGETGLATGPHLHYEVRDRDGRPLDPVRLSAAVRQARTARLR